MDKYNKAMTSPVFVVQTDPQPPPQTGLALEKSLFTARAGCCTELYNSVQVYQNIILVQSFKREFECSLREI